jgi:hypothetical protein
VAEIDERLRRYGIRVRLDAPLEGLTLCVIKEMLGNMMAEKGFVDAAVTHSATPVVGAGGSSLVKVTVNIVEGQRSRTATPTSVKPRPSPLARCNE